MNINIDYALLSRDLKMLPGKMSTTMSPVRTFNLMTVSDQDETTFADIRIFLL